MTDASLRLAQSGVVRISTAGPGDYLQLLKPRVMSLVVFTALAGLLTAPVHPDPVLGLVSLLAIAVGAGAAGALNMWYDADIDALMTRTAQRPVPRGTITPGEALAFGLTLAFLSVVTLGIVGQLARRGAARLHDLLLRGRLYDVAEAVDAAEHRDRRRRRRLPADRRLCRGQRHHRPPIRSSSSPLSSSGRRRISGRSRWSNRATMPARASR